MSWFYWMAPPQVAVKQSVSSGDLHRQRSWILLLALHFINSHGDNAHMSEHLKGILITALGVLMVVPDSLFVRIIVADPATITFWRALVAGSLIALGCLMVQGLAGFRAVLRTGWPGVLYTLLMATTAPGFVMAV